MFPLVLITYVILLISVVRSTPPASRYVVESSGILPNSTDLEGTSSSVYYMNERCSTDMDLPNRNAIRVGPVRSKRPKRDYLCAFTVGSYVHHHGYKLVVTFEKVAMSGSSGNCRHSILDMYDGTSSRSPIISERGGICGNGAKRTEYETTSRYLTLEYRTLDLNPSYQYFEAVITPFHEGTCRSDEFKCSNGNCIYEKLVCDSYNNCGDDSDEKHCGIFGLTIAAIIGIAVACVVVVAIIITILVCVCCCGCCACCAYESL